MMFVKKKIQIFFIMISILVILSLVGCLGLSTDETQITQIAKNIEEAIKEKDVDLFMENISHDYSDTDGGTYDNHMNGFPEDIFLNLEENEDLANFFSIFKIKPKVIIPESDIVVSDIYAIGKMEIIITLEACIVWVFCTDIYNDSREYNVDFQKEENEWKIISLEKM